MASNPNSKSRASFSSGPKKQLPATPPIPQAGLNQRPLRWELIILFLTITIGGTYLAIWMRPKNDAPRYTYNKKVLKTYPHDASAFTQGLLMDDGFLWESTGIKGESSVRKIDLDSGEILARHDLDDKYFGEGLAIHGDRLYQLTWKSHTAFVYNRELEVVGQREYSGQGWGLASNGTDLIFSNGTSEIKFLDPETFEVRRSVRVLRGGLRVGQLNELEFVNGKIYANVYQTDFIYEIDPETGDVTAVIDLAGLWPMAERPRDGLLNGIAFNPKTKKLLVTGKLCPKIFEIELELVD